MASAGPLTDVGERAGFSDAVELVDSLQPLGFESVDESLLLSLMKGHASVYRHLGAFTAMGLTTLSAFGDDLAVASSSKWTGISLG